MTKTTEIKIIYGEGKIFTDSPSRFVGGFQFDYVGDTTFNWQLPEGFQVRSNGRRVVAFNMNPNIEFDDVLCTYSGGFYIDPNSTIFVNTDAESIEVDLRPISDQVNRMDDSSINGMTKPLNKMTNKLRKRR